MQLLTGLSVGGAERLVLILTREMQARGHRVVVVGMTGGDEIVPMMKTSGLDVDGLDIRHLHMRRTAASFARAVAQVRAIVQRDGIRIIHAHLPHAAMLAMAVRAITPGVRIVFTSHNFGGMSGLQSRLFRGSRALRDADVLLGDGQHPDINARRHVVIPNGVVVPQAQAVAHAAAARRARGGAFTLLCVGSMNPRKNPLGLVDAMARLRAQRPDLDGRVRLRMAGGGPQLDAVRARVATQSLHGAVDVLGVRADVGDLMQQADALVIPSEYEGLPMVALEAGGWDLPVVSTPVGAMPALLADGCGFLAAGPAPDELAAALAAVVDDPDEAARRGERFGRRVRARYSHHRLVDEHLRLYATLPR